MCCGSDKRGGIERGKRRVVISNGFVSAVNRLNCRIFKLKVMCFGMLPENESLHPGYSVISRLWTAWVKRLLSHFQPVVDSGLRDATAAPSRYFMGDGPEAHPFGSKFDCYW